MSPEPGNAPPEQPRFLLSHPPDLESRPACAPWLQRTAYSNGHGVGEGPGHQG